MDTPCIEWLGYKVNGYGRIWVKMPNGRRRLLRVHRIEWEKVNGPIPGGMNLLHHCDNRACYRLDHLYVGTMADNVRDMDVRGRRGIVGHAGEAHPRAKLSDQQIEEIRASPLSCRKLAKLMGLNASWIGKIRRRVARMRSGHIRYDVRPLVGGVQQQPTARINNV